MYNFALRKLLKNTRTDLYLLIKYTKSVGSLLPIKYIFKIYKFYTSIQTAFTIFNGNSDSVRV